jgi:hypothetical protein
MQGRDFQVLQTYDEIGQAIENAVIAVLLDDDPGDPAPDWYEKQVEGWAKRIAESVQSQLDGA